MSLLFTSLLVGCTDNPVTGDTSTGGSSSTSTSNATDTPTAAVDTIDMDGTSSSTGGTTEDTSGSSSGTTGPGMVCETFLCGALLACCAADEACVAGECAPGCAGEVRCGDDLEVCCPEGQVCLDGACAAGTGACATNADCEPGSYCDPAAGQCFAGSDSPACSHPDEGIAVDLEWAFTEDEVITMPVVVDVTGDGVPEVIVSTTRQTGLEADYVIGELICLDGATGALVWRISDDPGNDRFGALGRATVAAGDVSGDGAPDIVYAGLYDDPVTKLSRIHAVDGDGEFLWTARNPDDSDVLLFRIDNAAPALVNLDDDPMAEIAFGAAIFDHDGLMVWNQGGNGVTVGSPHAKGMPDLILYQGGLPVFADLTGDARPELITGREAWSIDWVAGDPPVVTLTQLWQDQSGFGGDGWPAVADLDGNGTPEVVLVAWPEIKVLDGATGKLWCGVDATGVMCDGNDALRTQPIGINPPTLLGGPPTIADFDGDGRPEFGLTTGTVYTMFDLNRPGEEIVKPQNEPAPGPGDIYTRWLSPVQDKSSAATGSLAFDHDADGAAEVFYQDECYLRAYDGATGEVLLELANSTATIHEYPVVADVDGDGASELLLVANHSNAEPNQLCVQADGDWSVRKGVYAYGAAADDWTQTRRLWTQHSYHVTNADSAGNVPMIEFDNWTTPGLNDFRTAPHGEAVVSVTNAPDLTVSLAVGLAECGDSLVLRASVVNEGSLGVAAGALVRFYAGTDGMGEVLATVPTAVALVPGGLTVVETVVAAPPGGETASFYVEVDPEEAIGECFEANNGALAFQAGCPG